MNIQKSENIKFTKVQADEMRKYLGSYRCLLKNINAKTQHLKDFCNDMYNPLRASIPEGTTRAKGGFYDQAFSTLERIEKIYSKMIEKMERDIEIMQEKKDKIEQLIEQSGLDEEEKCVCIHRFMLGCRWADLPQFVGYEQSQCQRKERSALKKIYRNLKVDQQ